MDHPENLAIAFFIIEQYGEAVLVEREFRLGFPGDRIREGETLSLCARRVLSVFGRGVDESDLFQVVGGIGDWDGHPATFNIYATKPINTRRIAKQLAQPHPGKHRSFDRFIDVFMKAPHRTMPPHHRAQRLLSAA